MATLRWKPSPISPRRGEFTLEGHNQTYWLSTGDGQVYATASPARRTHDFPADVDGTFRVVARTRAAGPVLGTLTLTFPPLPPEVQVTQYADRGYSPHPPYLWGNIELAVTNAPAGAADAYIVDWGTDAAWPSRATGPFHPGAGQAARTHLPPGTHTATVTHLTTNTSARTDVVVADEPAMEFRPSGHRRVRAILRHLAPPWPDEDPEQVEVVVDWGDGTEPHVWTNPAVGSDAFHTYASTGPYTVRTCRIYDGDGACTETPIDASFQEG